jgi:zinc transport system substrate-binding protein
VPVSGPGGQLAVFAGIPPVAGLVERIGGRHVAVEVLVQPGQDPHVFAPTPRQAMALGKASLFFKIGLPLENRLVEGLSGRGRGPTVIDVSEGIVKRPGACDDDEPQPEAARSGAGGGPEPAAGEPDPHVWLSPPLLAIMAANIATALGRADPGHAGQYHRNLAALHADLKALDGRIRRKLAACRGQSFYVFHPAFGYFGQAYGLQQQSVEIEGKSPTPRQLRALIHRARAEGVKVVFLQPQFDPHSAESVAQAIGGRALPMDDLAKDVLGNLDDVATKIAAATQMNTHAE